MNTSKYLGEKLKGSCTRKSIQKLFQKLIRKKEDFTIEEYEVFQIC
jgi:hypothetical protein